MISRRLLAGLALPLAAWGCHPGGVPVATATRAPDAPAARRLPAALTPAAAGPTGGSYIFGTVTAPASVISNNGASVISNNGASLVSVVRVPVISDQGGSYGILGIPAGADGPLRDAFVVLADRDERFYRDKATGDVYHATTDAQGRFLFPGFPVGKDVVVTARLQDDLRMSGYLSPVAGENRLKLDVATTLATEYLRGAAVRQGKALGAFDAASFYDAAVLTEEAVAAGEIEAVTAEHHVAFDLHADQAERLRNQYAVAISAVAAGSEALHKLSDAWKHLLGERPVALTTVLDDASAPVAAGPVTGGVVGRVAAHAYAAIATRAAGDVVVADAARGLTWLKPDGTKVAVQLPPGPPIGGDALIFDGDALILASPAFNKVQRLPLADKVTATELLAGATTSFAGAPIVPKDPEDPYVVDGPAAYPLVVDQASPASSSWRLAEEGERKYASGAPVPRPARFAHLAGPEAVALDELGNLYIADAGNQRIRMIPKADGSAFGYRAPVGQDGLVTGFGAATPLKAGCIYTIAGNPAWQGGRWAGGYAGDGGRAQEARFDQPTGLAFFEGALYVADKANQRVRRIDRATGVVTTLAGNPGGLQGGSFPQGWAGDGGPAAQAHLANPAGLAVDAQRKLLYVSDTGSARVRAIDLAGDRHVIGTVAGRGRDPGGGTVGELHLTDGEALLWADVAPTGLAVDAAGNLLVAAPTQGRVCKVWRQWE